MRKGKDQTVTVTLRATALYDGRLATAVSSATATGRPRLKQQREGYEMRSSVAALTLVLMLWTVGRCAQGESANMMLNGDFAVDSDGDGMADHWQFSGDANVKVTWARDAGAHGGYSQKITCTQFAVKSPSSHAMLAQVNGFALRSGQWYRLSFNAKGEIASKAVNVGISDMSMWQSCGLSDVFRVRAEWRPQEFIFRANRDISTDIRLQIWFTEVGSLWIDDVRLEEVPAESAATRRRYTEVVPSIGSRNLVPNGSFECGTSGWGSIAQGVDWGDSGLIALFGRIDSEAPEDGASSFRIDIDKATAPVLAFDYFDVEQRPVYMALVANRGWISVTRGRTTRFRRMSKPIPPAHPACWWLARPSTIPRSVRSRPRATGSESPSHSSHRRTRSLSRWGRI